MSDETVIVKGTGTIFLGGPPLVKAATGEEVTRRGARRRRRPRPDLRGRRPPRPRRRARAGARAVDRRPTSTAGRRTRRGTAGQPEPPAIAAGATDAATPSRGLYAAVSADPRRPIDVREIIARLVDGSRFHEFKPLYGETLVCGFAHLDGYPVAIVANDGILFSQSRPQGRPLHRAGGPAPDPARLPPEHHRLHGRPRVRGRRDRQGRGQDGDRRRLRRGPQVHGPHRRQLRGRQLRDGRPGVRPALPVVVAEQPGSA